MADRISNGDSGGSAQQSSGKAEDRTKPNPPSKMNAEGLAGLYDSDNEDDMEEKGLDSTFLVRNDSKEVEKYVIHLKKLLVEGEGETVIELGIPIPSSSQKDIGIPEKDFEKAMKNHDEILKQIPAIGTAISGIRKNGTKCTQVHMIRDPPREEEFIEVRVAVVGNVDAGKSTLLGVLTHATLDDGRGAARTKLFRHKHEFESGRTSSVGNDILGFGVHGEVVNKPDPHNNKLDWVQIDRDCSKLITFIDLAGHEKYLKTTIFGMTGHNPDYTMLMVGSNMGIIGTTKEHLSLALSLQVPVFIVVTKIDMCPPQVLEETMQNISRLIKSVKKIGVIVRTMDDVISAAANLPSKRVCPIFQVSNVTGTNLDLLKSFMNIIPLRRSLSENDPAHFQIDDVYWVEGVGTVVSGTCLAGVIRLNDVLLLGPNSLGEFNQIPIKSIHRKRMPVSVVRCGQTASFALRKISKREVRKGMVLVDPRSNPTACIQFQADILILHHPTTIRTNYQAMLHIGSVRQTATLVSMGKELLRTGDRDRATFRFIRLPEFIKPGTRMVFREGRTKAVGTVVEVSPQEPTQAKTKQKERVHKQLFKKGPKPPNNMRKDKDKEKEDGEKKQEEMKTEAAGNEHAAAGTSAK